MLKLLAPCWLLLVSWATVRPSLKLFIQGRRRPRRRVRPLTAPGMRHAMNGASSPARRHGFQSKGQATCPLLLSFLDAIFILPHQMAGVTEAEPVMVRARSHPHERATYIECVVHVDGNQLCLVKHGGPTEIIALARDRVISTPFKHNHYYVIVHSCSSIIKFKLHSTEMQSRLVEAFQNKISDASTGGTLSLATAASKSDAHRRDTMPMSPQSPKSNEVRPSLLVDDAEEGLVFALQNCSFASSDTSTTRSSISAIFNTTNPPTIPPRPAYTYTKRDYVKSRHRTLTTGSSSSSGQHRHSAQLNHSFPVETTVSPEGCVTSSV